VVGSEIGESEVVEQHERLDAKDLPSAIRQPMSITSIATVGLFLLACFYTLYFARVVLKPVALAVLLDFLLKPVVRALGRLKIPEAVGAALVLITLLGGATYGVYALSGPAATWLERAPRSLRLAEHRIRELRRPMESMSETAEKLAEMASPDGGTPNVEVTTEDLRSRLLRGAREFLFQSVAVVVLLYFLMASGDLFLRKLVKVLPTWGNKKRAVEIARETERHISTYLSTVTLINMGLGAAVGTAVWLAGLPSPVLWGVMVAVLNFVPYLGATAGIGILTVVSLLTFDSPWRALVPPGVYLACATLEGNFITPVLLGRQFTLNPVAVFIWLALWGFLWGIPGMLVAVPLLAILKIICDHVTPLLPLGELLAK
jgi:predicted PurR-regulated permease PerM